MENQTTFPNDQNLLYQRPLAQIRSPEGLNNPENEETASDETKFCKNPLKIARQLSNQYAKSTDSKGQPLYPSGSNPEFYYHRYNSNTRSSFFSRRGKSIVALMLASLLAIIFYTYYLSSWIMPNMYPGVSTGKRVPLTTSERRHPYDYNDQSMMPKRDTILENLDPTNRIQNVATQDLKQKISELRAQQAKHDTKIPSNNADISESLSESFSSTIPSKTHASMFFGTGSFGGHSLTPVMYTGDSKMDSNAFQNIFPGNIQLPGFKMSWDPRIGSQVDVVHKIPRDLPVFWNIPFSGASVLINIMRSCHRLVTTTTGENLNNGFFNHESKESNVVVQGSTPLNRYDPLKLVNIDMSTNEGILHAQKIGLANHAFVDIIITPHIFKTDHIFYGTDTRGRLFALFKDPVERAVDMFYYMKHATWEPTYDPKFQHMSIDQYSKSIYIQNNWMTRTLANIPAHEQLTKEHLNIALEVMRTRILVGLSDSLEESLDRFERYFSWRNDLDSNTQILCRSRFISRGYVNPNPKFKNLEQGTGAYHRIQMQNRFDLEIYEYAQSLFFDQREFVSKLVLKIT